jgi:hypothetical protein
VHFALQPAVHEEPASLGLDRYQYLKLSLADAALRQKITAARHERIPLCATVAHTEAFDEIGMIGQTEADATAS